MPDVTEDDRMERHFNENSCYNVEKLSNDEIEIINANSGFF